MIKTNPLEPKKLNVGFLDRLIDKEAKHWRKANADGTPITIGDVVFNIFCINDAANDRVQIDAIWTDEWYMGTAGANIRLEKYLPIVTVIHDNARWYLSGDVDKFEEDLAILRMCFDASGLTDDDYD